MKEYIEKAALLENLNHAGILSRFVKFKIERFPAADVAEVVRCKDCKHKVRTDANGIVICSEEHGMYCPTESDSCSYGEYQTNTGGVTE